MRIRDMPIDERPSKRLRRFGVGSLSDSELLSIVLGGDDGLLKARKHLANGLYRLAQQERSTTKLEALFELARRVQAERGVESEPVSNAESVATRLVSLYSHYVQERLGAVFLDAKGRVRSEREIYVGTLNSTVVSTRDIIRIAIAENAAGLIVFHNHPSGDPSPSAEDLVFTRKLSESACLFSIDLVDHLILGQNRFVSLRERGVI